MAKTGIGEQKSLVKITYKSPDSNGNWDDFAIMENKFLSMLSAQLVPKGSGLITYDHQINRSATIVYTKVQPTETANLYRTADESELNGVTAVGFLDEVRSISVIMTNITIDPHGYIEKANANN